MIDQPAPKHVFMSYSRKDEAVMRLITEFLRKQGINVWVDNEKLVPGTPIWEVEIEKAIRAAGAVVVLLSPYSNASIWVRREISFAERYSKRIFPLLIDGDEDTSIMLRLSTSQYVDIRENEDVGLNSLRAALSFYLEDLENQEIKARKEAERLARKKAEQEAAKRDAKGKASKQKAEREAAEKAAQEKAEKEAKEKAEREAAEKAAREKAAKEKAEREATEKAAREKAEREAAEKAAREKAEREADEKAKRKKAELRAAKWKAYNPRIFFPKLQSFFDIQLRDKGRIILSSWQSLEEISWPRISKAIRIFLITYIIAEFLLIAFDIGKINTDTTSLKFYDISWFWIVIEIVIGVVTGISLGIYDEDAEEAYDEEAIYEADIPIWVQIVSFIWGSIGFLIWGFCTISFSFLFLGKFNLGDNVYVGLWLLSLVPAIFLGIDGGWRWWNGARKYFIT